MGGRSVSQWPGHSILRLEAGQPAVGLEEVRVRAHEGGLGQHRVWDTVFEPAREQPEPRQVPHRGAARRGRPLPGCDPAGRLQARHGSLSLLALREFEDASLRYLRARRLAAKEKPIV